MTISSDANRSLVRRLLDETVSGGDFAVSDELVADDARFFGSHARPEPYIGPQGVREYIGAVRAGIPDAFIDIHSLVAEGDTVIAHWTLRGTHTGTLNGVPPSGRSLALEALELVRLRDGRIIEVVLKLDSADFMRQLGLISASGKLPAPLLAVLKVRGAMQLATARLRGQRADR